MKWLLISLIKTYQLVLSPFAPNRCRFFPTCSCYAITTITQHGAFVGLLRSVIRLMKCHPFHPGGYDPAR